MHDAILKAALTIAAAYGVGGPSPPVKLSEVVRPALVRPLAEIEFTMGVIAPPPCIDLKMVRDASEFSSATPVLGLDTEARRRWREQVAQCAGVTGPVRLVLTPPLRK
ncbi:MAG: hypothetical protein ABL957_00330 [Parvularculaceae bacterium]